MALPPKISGAAMLVNRATLLTAPGVAAIAVVRLGGPGVGEFLKRRFSKPVPQGRCVHGILSGDHLVIDDALAVRHGDVLDLNLHGGSWVVHSAMELAKQDGFELSDQDSEDAIAVDNPIWQQVLRSLPSARTEQAARMLLAQPAAWQSPGDLRAILEDRGGWWLLNPPRVAIVGPANVGKSTLANQLFGQARSITADLPGTTRDWVGEIANIDGLAVMLVDTPGIRFTADPIEDAAIAGSREQIRSADLVVLVLDHSAPLDQAMIDAYPSAIVAANKADHGIGETPATMIKTVATTGQGIDDLRKEIRRRFGCEPMDLNRPRWWTEDQRAEIGRMIAGG